MNANPRNEVPRNPPKLQEVRDAQGSVGKLRKAHEPNSVSIEQIRPPRNISVEALDVWHEIVPDIERYGYLRQSDAIMLGQYCDLVSQHRSLSISLREEGFTAIVSSKAIGERVKPSALFVMQGDLIRLMTTLADRFGLSPMMRTSLLARLPGPPPVGLPKTEGSDVVMAADDGNELDAIGFLN